MERINITFSEEYYWWVFRSPDAQDVAVAAVVVVDEIQECSVIK
jgi:hypothetical protein